MQDTERDFWLESQKLISKEISRQNFDTWIKPVKMHSISGDAVVLDVPNRFFKEWLLEHFFELLTKTLKDVLEKDEIELSFNIARGHGQDISEAGHEPEEEPAREKA